MFNKRKKGKEKSQLQKCEEIFDDYLDENNEDRKIVDALYIKIKEKYEEKLKKNKLNIKLERIRIQKSLGNFRVKTKENNEINRIIATIILTSILTVTLRLLETTMENGLGIVSYLITMYALMHSMAKDRQREPDLESDLVNYISSLVLDELESKYF